MKKLLRTRPRWLLVLTPILAAVLLTLGYLAIAKSRRADIPQTNNREGVSSLPQAVNLATYQSEEDEPALSQKRNEYLNRFYGTGPGQVSIADFAASLAAARALPPSPLLAGGNGTSGVETPQPWTYPLPPPLANPWDPPGGGGASVRIDTIAVDPTDPDTLYVGSEGGLAKSTDGADHWTYLSDDLTSQSIRCIAIDPSMPNIVYAGTGTRPHFGVGIFRSTDAGATWSIFGEEEFTGSTICKILIDPATAGSESKTTLYASVIKTYTNPFNRTHTVWQSDDSGESWTSLRIASAAGPGLAHYDLAIDSSGRLYVTAPDGVFRREPDTSFTMIHSIDAAQANAPSFLALDNNSVLYLAYREGPAVNDWTVRITKSSDQGDNWTDLKNPGSDLYCFGVDPVYPDRIFVGGYPTALPQLRYTLDGGSTWLSIPDIHVDNHAIAFCPTNPPGSQRYYLGTDGGIHRADYDIGDPAPSTVTFYSTNQHLPGMLTGGVAISKDDSVFIGTEDNGNQLSTQAHPAWVMIHPFIGGDGTRGFIEVQNNTQKIYALAYFPSTVTGGGSGAPARIINGVGTNVTPPLAIREYTNWFPALSVTFKAAPDPDRVIVGFQHVWRSENSGDSWTRMGGTPCPTPPPGGSPAPTPTGECGIEHHARIVSVYEAPSDPSFIYAITHRSADPPASKILVTSNAGPNATWENITGSLVDNFNAVIVHPNDPETAYVAANSHVYKTTDRGDTWTTETVGPDFIFHDVVFHPANPDQILVASNRGIFARVNGNWGSMNTGLPAGMEFWNLSFNQYSHQLAASSWGRGVYILDLDRVPPTATISSPAYGAYVRGTVTVLGTALDNHRVADAQFKLDGANFGGGIQDPPSNVSVVWNTTLSTNASHTLTLLVHDAYGSTTTSIPVTVTVDNLAPTVSITAPEDGKKVAGTVTVEATASDNFGVAGVQFTVDGDNFGQEDTSAPFEIDWDTTGMDNGEHRLRAIARDAAGNTTTSDGVTVNVAN